MEIFYCNYYWSYVFVDISYLREPQCIEMGPRYCSLQDTIPPAEITDGYKDISVYYLSI
jgi:hypothetical protein